MKAAVYSRRDIEGVKVDSAFKKPSSTDVPVGFALIQVVCAGVNPVDAKAQIGDKLPESMESFARWLMEGYCCGFDFSGVVVQVAENSSYKPGDEVIGTMPPLQGSMREYVLAPLHQIARKPTSLSHAKASALPLVGLTAYQSLKIDYDLKQGDHLLLIGASGGVGHVAIQVAKRLGARVTAVCSARNADWVKELGADTVVDYTSQPIIETLRGIVSQHGPFDMVFDCVSSHDSRDSASFNYEREIRAVPSLLNSAYYITIGGKTHQWIAAGLKRTIGVNLFSWFSPKRELFWIRFPHSSEALQTLSAWADEGAVRPAVSEIVSFDDQGVRQAFASLHSRRVAGKVAIEIKSST